MGGKTQTLSEADRRELEEFLEKDYQRPIIDEDEYLSPEITPVGSHELPDHLREAIKARVSRKSNAAKYKRNLGKMILNSVETQLTIAEERVQGRRSHKF